MKENCLTACDYEKKFCWPPKRLKTKNVIVKRGETISNTTTRPCNKKLKFFSILERE